MLECIGIGSLPYENPQEALKLVQNYFNEIPFWPQLINRNKNEDMLLQFLEGMPSFFSSSKEEQIVQFLSDYKEITENNNLELLEKYGISETFSSTFKLFLDIAKNHKYAKGQIIGPYTLSQTIKSETLGKDIIVKTLVLKALWQIEKIKKTGAKPIILIDEPLLYKAPSNAISMIKILSDMIKYHGGISGVHCCSECDWSIPIKANVKIINPDIYNNCENFTKYHSQIKSFLEEDGKIAWGIIPTEQSIENENLESITEKFDRAVKYLTKNGINEKLIIENSYITQSCGAGSLTTNLAEKVMRLTKELSDSLKERYNDNQTGNYR